MPDSDKIDYFFTALDFHLATTRRPKKALRMTVEDYAAVFHTPEDNCPPVGKAVAQARLRGAAIK